MKTFRNQKNHPFNRLLIQKAISLLFLLLNFTSVFSQREIHTINDGWKFHKGECPNASETNFKDSLWQTVSLPHTWNSDAYTCKDYYRGTGWYRRNLTIPARWEDKQIFLKLDGANKSAEIYVNGKSVGEHVGGYTACVFNITPLLSAGHNNTLAIRVDNSRQDVPPISGDFTFFGGIYRDVWLIATTPQHFHFTNYGAEGISITTPEVSKEKGIIDITTEIKNSLPVRSSSLEVSCSIYNPSGELLQTHKKKLSLKEKEQRTVTQKSEPIANPLLWSPETPSLYRVDVELRNPSTGEVLDKISQYTGFRWFHFDGKKGFFLNGEPYKLRGICRHQDQKPMGPALTDEMHRRDFQLMKDMGANFIRISHYPQDDALLEMCDKQGMLVWEEIPIIDIVPDTPRYDENCERNLKEMVYQHTNHPSIILWGYMNEILLVSQRKYKTEKEFKPVLERTLKLAQRLENTLKSIDSTRTSVMAFHGSNLYNETKLSEITDVVGWNLYAGWYGDNLSGFERFLDFQQKNYPNHPLIVSEYGAGSDRRLHSLAPRAFDFSIEYQQTYLEHYLPVLEETPYVCGGSHWNFIDFSSAQRDESMPRINNKGLVYSNRMPKDVYYYYQAMWRNDIPVLHIASRDWKHRSCIVKDTALCLLPVKVYTNLPEVELFIDGKSIGTQKVRNCTATFRVPFQHKMHFISARGIYKDQKVEDGQQVYFIPIPETLNDSNLRTLELAVNVGSNCFFTSDESQLTWLPDQAYTQGSWGYIGGKPQSTQTEITQTTDGPLYQTLREGLESYRFDVPQGTYEVELLFTDIYRPSAQSVYLLGKNDGNTNQAKNSFDILANGSVIESNFAPSQSRDYFQAVKRRYIIQNTQDYLLLTFKPIQGKSFLSGIKLRKL